MAHVSTSRVAKNKLMLHCHAKHKFGGYGLWQIEPLAECIHHICAVARQYNVLQQREVLQQRLARSGEK